MITTSLVAEHTHGLATLARTHDHATPIATCGDWSLADLAWHLAEVQLFWGHAIGNRPAGPDTYDPPERPGNDELPDLLDAACTNLVRLLDAADPGEHAWTWSDDQTVRFVTRRQVHEAIIHHIDGVLSVGDPLPHIDPAVATDGVDEMVTVMLGGIPDWAEFHPDDATIRLTASDADVRHDLRFGRMTGISPDTGTTYDIAATLTVDEPAAPTTSVSGPALSLELWMWGRADGADLNVDGDRSGADRLRALVVECTQ